MTMMGTPIGTKNFVDARPETSVQSKDTGERNLSANDLKRLGEDNVGDLLNKAVDPNWVDPSKKVRAVGSDKMGKDAFMKLMLAQMKNQDPTNPLKSHEMAAQLAQFSGLEQMQNMNTTLEEIKKGQKPAETYQALNFIGKAVAGDSAKISRLKGDVNHDFHYVLPEDAKDVKLTLKNDAGEVVRKITLKDLKKGENTFTWNGKDERDLSANIGEYQFTVEATDGLGKKLHVKTDFDGVITGVNYTPEGPILLVGNQTVKLSDVRKIVDPTVQQPRQLQMMQKQPANVGPATSQAANDQNLQNRPSAELQNVTGVSQTNQVGAQEQGAQEAPPNKFIPGVAMQRELMNQLEKETK